jgi:predicted Zn-dependent peptidase
MIQNKRLFFITTAACILLFLFPAPLFSYDIENRIQSFTLKNGLRLLMLERHLSPTVSIYIRYRSGAVDEADGKTGTAHLLEHMMFKGTTTIGARNYPSEQKLLSNIEAAGTALDREKMKGDKGDRTAIERLTQRLKVLQESHRQLFVSNDIDRLYTENGAVGLNASTGQDLTTYQVSIPSNRIELWARIESDRMMNPVFREFYTERDVVMEERRQRSESDPDGKLLERYLAAAFITHPYRRPVIGWASDIPFLDLAYMRRFLKNTHAPNNTVIAVVGDIRPSEVLRLVKKYFGPIPAQKLPLVPATKEPVQSGERRVEVLYGADPKLIIGYHKPPPPDLSDYVFDLIESLLTRGRTARLYKTLVEEKGLAKSIQAHNGMPGARYPNQFVFFATPRHPHTNLDLERAIDEEIERLKSEPVSDSELEKWKNQLRADFIRGLDSNAGLAGMLSYYEALMGDYRYLTGYTAAIDKITPDEIRQAARAYLTRENKTVASGVRKPVHEK